MGDAEAVVDATDAEPMPATAAHEPAAVFRNRRRSAMTRSTSAMMKGEHMIFLRFTFRSAWNAGVEPTRNPPEQRASAPAGATSAARTRPDAEDDPG